MPKRGGLGAARLSPVPAGRSNPDNVTTRSLKKRPKAVPQPVVDNGATSNRVSSYSYVDRTATAATVKVRFPPDLSNGGWRSLRRRFASYLRDAPVGAPPEDFVDFAVTKEEKRMLQTTGRRLLELQVDPEVLRKMFNHMYEHLESDDPATRKNSAYILFRLAKAHFDSDSPQLIETFRAAHHFLDRSHKEENVGNRDLAARIMTVTNPLLSLRLPETYKVAELLRFAIVEQRNDVINLMRAYGGLVHCFLSSHTEVTEGKATFSGLYLNGKTREIKEFAREVFEELAVMRR
jgi:hypothetical protein